MKEGGFHPIADPITPCRENFRSVTVEQKMPELQILSTTLFLLSYEEAGFGGVYGDLCGWVIPDKSIRFQRV